MSDENLERRVSDVSRVSGQTDPVDSESSQAGSEFVTELSISSTTWEGPLPHPDVLNAYAQIVEGGAERIFALTEGQAHHRQELEKQAV